MSLKMNGKVTHDAFDGKVNFSFLKEQSKKTKDLDTVSYDYNTNLAFEIYKKFKNSDVEIVVTKKKE